MGLTTFYVSEGQNLNFALPVEWLKELPTRHKVQTLAEDSTVDWLAKALVLESRQDWEGLLAHAQQWVNAQPKNAHGWLNLGVAYDNLEQSAKAVAPFQQALRLGPKDANTWNNLGLVYFRLKQWAKAVEAFQQVLRLDPEHAYAWYMLGRTYYGYARPVGEGRRRLPASSAAEPRTRRHADQPGPGLLRLRLDLCRDGSPGPSHGGVPEAERAGCGSSRKVFPEVCAPIDAPILHDPSPDSRTEPRPRVCSQNSRS